MKFSPLLAAAPLLVAAQACSKEPRRIELSVYAASSTSEALQALEAGYERDHGVDLVFHFGSSGDLSKRIRATAEADVFLSADELEMDKVEEAEHVISDTRRPLLSNHLVVIEPAGGPSIFTMPFEPAQLADPRVRLLSLANVQSVPAGRYARAWLEQVGIWEQVSDRVLPGVDVSSALDAVESAGAQAGIVYRTDVDHSKKARIVFTVPIDRGPRITYPVAALAMRPNEKAARAFVDFLTSPGARSAFEDLGFVFLPTLPEGSQ